MVNVLDLIEETWLIWKESALLGSPGGQAQTTSGSIHANSTNASRGHLTDFVENC